MIRPWKLQEISYAHVKDVSYEVAVLPLGATEPHNLHLPYGTDIFEADVVGEKICQAAHVRGAQVVLLPTIPYGTETNQSKFPLSMNVMPTTLYSLITDLVESLVGHGIQKIVLLNSHGGNDLKPLLRELYGRTPAALFLCNWYQIFRDVYNDIFTHPDDHAGEMETSLMLAYRPELVGRDDRGQFVADAGAKAPSRFEAVNHGWVSVTRPWHLLTSNTGAGNPHEATAEKGYQAMELLVERLGTFLLELSQSTLDERFPM